MPERGTAVMASRQALADMRHCVGLAPTAGVGHSCHVTPATQTKQVEQRERPETPNQLDEVVEQVRADAEREPEKYARDAIVPKGGE